MPDFPIVDAHVHLWDPGRFRMPWLDGNALLGQPFDLPAYDEHTAGAGVAVASMVYLEVDVAPAYALLEARWAVERARRDPRLQGVVAWAPIEDGERARSVLDVLAALDPCVKGVRRILQGESDPAFGLRPDVLRGLRLLPEYGFSFDICIRHYQLPATVEMVRRCPETRFILDHLGKPDVKGRELDPWRAELRALAALPNVTCKVSGLVTEGDHGRWTADDLAPYVAHALDVFGEDRVVFGGDWPVALAASSYRRWVETLDTFTVSLSAEARRKLWAENARRFYRLPPTPGTPTPG